MPYFDEDVLSSVKVYDYACTVCTLEHINKKIRRRRLKPLQQQQGRRNF